MVLVHLLVPTWSGSFSVCGGLYVGQSPRTRALLKKGTHILRWSRISVQTWSVGITWRQGISWQKMEDLTIKWTIQLQKDQNSLHIFGREILLRKQHSFLTLWIMYPCVMDRVRTCYQGITVWALRAEPQVHAVIPWQQGLTLHDNRGNHWL